MAKCKQKKIITKTQATKQVKSKIIVKLKENLSLYKKLDESKDLKNKLVLKKG